LTWIGIYNKMDQPSVFEESKITDKYSGLDESLKFVQSLVSTRLRKQEFAFQNKSFTNKAQEGTSLNKDQDMPPEENADSEIEMDVENPSESEKLNQSHSSILSSHDKDLNVEDRLYKMNTIYKKRREEKLKAAQKEEQSKEIAFQLESI